ncbi:MAG: glycosyltransferase family 2 protein [Verrucomicrobia bacterium]|nr:MAG: glycosyltransferase family 2 protein [Verrucomicrobiota bacterium]
MKLIVQIPCFNEEATLPETLAAIPRAIEGVDQVEIMVIDDGSGDETSRVARRSGTDHVLRLPRNQGLARAFSAGIEHALGLGADIIVNTDADNQYCADDIPALIAPILLGEADIVIGERPIESIEHFSPIKKVLQRLGSAAVRFFSQTEVRDAPSGFRAFSRRAAMRLNVFNEYTYTLETVIQAGQKHMAIASVPIRVNNPTRESRLVRNIPDYVRRSIATILRVFIVYRPLRFFSLLSALTFLPGFILGLRFFYYFVIGQGQGKIQSVVLAAFLMGLGFLLLVIGIVTDLISVNRKLLEQANARLFEIEDRINRLTR